MRSTLRTARSSVAVASLAAALTLGACTSGGADPGPDAVFCTAVEAYLDSADAARNAVSTFNLAVELYRDDPTEERLTTVRVSGQAMADAVNERTYRLLNLGLGDSDSGTAVATLEQYATDYIVPLGLAAANATDGAAFLADADARRADAEDAGLFTGVEDAQSSVLAIADARCGGPTAAPTASSAP